MILEKLSPQEIKILNAAKQSYIDYVHAKSALNAKKSGHAKFRNKDFKKFAKTKKVQQILANRYCARALKLYIELLNMAYFANQSDSLKNWKQSSGIWLTKPSALNPKQYSNYHKVANRLLASI